MIEKSSQKGWRRWRGLLLRGGLLLLLSAILAVAIVISGCGSSETSPGSVALAYTHAMAELNLGKACELTRKRLRSPAYRGKSSAELYEECELSLLYPSPPAPSQLPDIGLIKRYYALPAARVNSEETSGDRAIVILSSPTEHEPRRVVLDKIDGRWLVHNFEAESFFGP